MATVAAPARRQRGGWVPAHAKAQGQRVANCDFCVARVARDAVRGGCVDGARGCRLGRCVHEEVDEVAYVQVAELQRAG